MNSPYNPVFNVCRWRGHFGNRVGIPRAVLCASTPNMVIGPREGNNQVELAASACEWDLAIGGCDEQTCGWSIGSFYFPLSFPNPF